MINYDSILSAFDGKPTLLQWLKMVKKALDESILKNVNITQNGQKVVFTFNFEDGTSISTPEVTLPKGDKGDKGENGVGIVNIETSGSNVVGVNTESTIRVELSDGSVKQFKTYAKNGTDGVSITGINTVGNEVVGDETLTTLRAHYSNNTTNEFVVKAKNGKNDTNIYYHLVSLINEDGYEIRFTIHSQIDVLDINVVLNQIPYINGFLCFYAASGDDIGIGSILRVQNENKLVFRGIINNPGTNDVIFSTFNFNVVSINDTLIGVNL